MRQISLSCGDLDLCGFKRPQSTYHDVLWGDEKQVYVAVHAPISEGKTPTISYWGWPDVRPSWTWPGREEQPVQVDVYSSCHRVELFLNGMSLGVQPTTRDEKFVATFNVPYEVGALRAVGYADDRQVAEYTIETASAPTRIRLAPDRDTIKAQVGDLSFVTVEILDREGRVHPNASHTIYFTAQGQGAIAAVGSGDPVSTEGYRGNQRSAFRGRCLVVVQSNGEPGEVHLLAHADGLAGAKVAIQVN